MVVMSHGRYRGGETYIWAGFFCKCMASMGNTQLALELRFCMKRRSDVFSQQARIFFFLVDSMNDEYETVALTYVILCASLVFSGIP